MPSDFQRLKDEVLALVSGAPNQRLRPHEVGKGLAHKLGVSMRTVQEAVKDLAKDGQLVFTYRDPTSYIEIPAPSESTRPIS